MSGVKFLVLPPGEREPQKPGFSKECCTSEIPAFGDKKTGDCTSSRDFGLEL